ncbi:50S ribosomal protein L15 [Methanomicrobium antiquum]|jgi:large subunit ribosomal protein L15|uniref:Large ribosomal subunit protein uL15 n=1 Tax=Methanomicrobium antiquum TaxID=487686 RepID=A0AAF0FW29_9EURY|nr:uL15m family ribosomal protein [Methanomicrobium antiquum]MDD3977002.1 uL15 family ribosomal protein [Methanomicrobium sp.]WFN37388.1 50S ribosomal protein L15 [Methanomicrobium antiquum]
MPVNKRSKYRGSRTCGGGTHKNRRGAGNRGGKGRAGHRDHRFTHYLLLDQINNGKHGFVNQTESKNKVIDVGDLDQILDKLVASGLARVDGDIFVIDAEQIGIDKILGGGKVTHKLNITAEAFSETAKAKIEEMGGQALTA